MDSDLRKPYNHNPRYIGTKVTNWPCRRRKPRRELVRRTPAKPLPPPPSVKHRGWRNRNKNRPVDRTMISIVDGGWNGPVQLLDPAKGAPAPPRNSETRPPWGGWGGGRSEEPVPVYVRHGPFRFDLLPTEIQLRVVECVLVRRGEAAWNIWATAGWVRDLCSRVQRSWNRDRRLGSGPVFSGPKQPESIAFGALLSAYGV